MFNNRILMDDNVASNLPERSKELQNLYEILEKQQTSGRVMFGHHDTLAYGRSNGGWRGGNLTASTPKLSVTAKDSNNKFIDESDILYAICKYPKIFSWDIRREDPSTADNSLLINNVHKSILVDWIKKVHRSEGINTICWHCHNPRSLGDVNDCSQNAVEAILDPTKDGSVTLDRFYKWVDELCDFFNSLVDDNGNKIPLIFRPFHEQTSYEPFFWWHYYEQYFHPKLGRNIYINTKYNELWKKLLDRMKNNPVSSRNVTNTLFCFSINDFFLQNDYKDDGTGIITKLKDELFPNVSDYDIISFDAYQRFWRLEQITGTNNNHPVANGYFSRPYNSSRLNNPPTHPGDTDGHHHFGLGDAQGFGFLGRQKINAKYIMQFAKENNKIVALTEIGADYINFENNWFTNTMGQILATTIDAGNSKKMNFAYTTLWRNPCPKTLPDPVNNVSIPPDPGEYYAPFLPDSPSLDYSDSYNQDFSKVNLLDFLD